VVCCWWCLPGRQRSLSLDSARVSGPTVCSFSLLFSPSSFFLFAYVICYWFWTFRTVPLSIITFPVVKLFLENSNFRLFDGSLVGTTWTQQSLSLQSNEYAPNPNCSLLINYTAIFLFWNSSSNLKNNVISGWRRLSWIWSRISFNSEHAGLVISRVPEQSFCSRLLKASLGCFLILSQRLSIDILVFYPVWEEMELS